MTAGDPLIDVLFPRQDERGGRLPLTDEELYALELTTPLLSAPSPAILHKVRNTLCGIDENLQDSLAQHIKDVKVGTLSQLRQYVDLDGHPNADRLYILEFHGWQEQYLKFGHSKNLLNRTKYHSVVAARHRYTLLNGWASPSVPNGKCPKQLHTRAPIGFRDHAQCLESTVLDIASHLHSFENTDREFFFNMPFEKGVAIARAVFETCTGWRTRTDNRVPRDQQPRARRAPDKRTPVSERDNAPAIGG